MKKAIACLLAALSLLPLFAACADNEDAADDGTIHIVSTIFPSYDWMREILGDDADHVNLTLLLDSGTDLHSYQPTTDDIITLSTADMVIYVGGTSDEWVADAVQAANNENLVAVNLIDILGDAVKEEDIVEGMQNDHEEDEKDHEEPELDEHVWLSLKNAQIFCEYFSEKLGEIDPEHTSVYETNAQAYLSRLNALDDEYTSVAANSSFAVLLFGDRFPFRYLMDDYGLAYYAAFPGCSAETEASFETVIFLAEKVNELDLHSVVILESSAESIADTIIGSTAKKNQEIVVFHSMQSVKAVDIEAGTTYLSIMESNLEALKQALR